MISKLFQGEINGLQILSPDSQALVTHTFLTVPAHHFTNCCCVLSAVRVQYRVFIQLESSVFAYLLQVTLSKLAKQRNSNQDSNMI